VEPAEELEPGATPEDLEHIVAASEAGGHIDRQLSILLDRGLDFRRRTAGEAMTARVDVVAISVDQPCTRVVELLASGHSRFPVVGPDGVDDVIGMVAIADLLRVPGPERATTPVRTVATPALFLPASMPLRTVLEELRRARRQLACVVDEYGGFAGVVSLEDVAEELVGPIQDEDDLPEPAPRRQPDGGWLVPAQWRIDELVDATGLELPESDDYDTLSGLVLSVLGRVPQEGDTVAIPTDAGRHIEARVVTVRRHVPNTVYLSQPQPGPQEEQA
jgi:CBS domain containing-hemolysin-like protein